MQCAFTTAASQSPPLILSSATIRHLHPRAIFEKRLGEGWGGRGGGRTLFYNAFSSTRGIVSRLSFESRERLSGAKPLNDLSLAACLVNLREPFSRPLAIFSYGYKCHVGRCGWVQSFTEGCLSQAPLRSLIRAGFSSYRARRFSLLFISTLARLSPFSVLLRETLSLSLPSLNNEGGRQVARNEGERAS